MDTEFLVRFVTVCALLIGIANTVLIWWWRGSDQNATKIKAIEDKQDEHERRLGTAEAELRHLPTKEDIQALRVEVAELTASFRAVSRTVDRIDDYLRGKAA